MGLAIAFILLCIVLTGSVVTAFIASVAGDYMEWRCKKEEKEREMES